MTVRIAACLTDTVTDEQAAFLLSSLSGEEVRIAELRRRTLIVVTDTPDVWFAHRDLRSFRWVNVSSED